MNLKELFELVHQWSRWGLKRQCFYCDNEITISPEDRAVVCNECESAYTAMHLWLQELIDLVKSQGG